MQNKKTLLLTLMAGLSLVSANTKAGMPAFVETGYNFFIEDHLVETVSVVGLACAASWYTRYPEIIWGEAESGRSRSRSGSRKTSVVCSHGVKIGNMCTNCPGNTAAKLRSQSPSTSRSRSSQRARRAAERASKTVFVNTWCKHDIQTGESCDSCKGYAKANNCKHSVDVGKYCEGCVGIVATNYTGQ